MIETHTPVTVTINDARSIGYCSSGLRAFFAQHQLNWTGFLQHGVESTILEQFDDEMVRAAIAQARTRIKAET